MTQKKYLLSGFVLTVGLILAFGIYYSRNVPVPTPTASPAHVGEGPTPLPSNPVTDQGVEEALRVVRLNRAFTIPQISDSKPITMSVLPEEIQFLLGGLEDLKINRLTYENSKRGFEVTYISSKILHESFYGLTDKIRSSQNKYGWTIKEGNRTNLAALINLENVEYLVEIELVYLDDKSSKFSMKALAR